jgi:TonB-linked SusC/RagA family outer membrane protein
MLSGMYQNSTPVENLKFLDDDPSKSYYKANHNNTGWLSLINKPSVSRNYGVSVRGGDAVALYSFSLGYNDSEGNIKNTGFSRLNVRFNSDISLTKNFKLLFDIAFAQTSNNMRSDGIDAVASPVYLSMIKSPLYSPYQYNTDGALSNKLSGIDELNVGNPLSVINSGIGISQKYRFNTLVCPSYTFNEKVKLNLLFNYTWDKLNEESFRPSEGLAALPLVNEYGEIYAYSANMVKNRMGRQNSIYADAYINWTPVRNYMHHLDLHGGFRFYSDSYVSNYGEGHNTGSDRMNSLDNTTSSLRYSTGISEDWRSMSWYLNLDYKYANRYLFSISTATDASSRFGKNAAGALKMGGIPWGVFPSVSAGWLISSEDFMKNVSFIDFLKLDASYSISGNDNLPDYASRAYFTSISYMGNAYGLVLDNLRNENLKWETTYRRKVGLDFSLFDNRLSVRTDFFDSNTKDLLTRKRLEEIAGIKYFRTNDGELQNRGFEIASNIRLLNMRRLNLDFGLMVGRYKNKIMSLADGFYVTDFQGAQILTAEGHPAAVFYGYKTKGVFSTVQEAAGANLSIVSESGVKIPFQAGDMYFEEVEVDNIIDEKDRQVIGNPNPDFYGNFNFSLKYKNLTVETLFAYSYGNEAYNALRANLESGNHIYNQATSMQKRWVANGQKTNIPRAVYNDPMGNSRFSDRWIEDASFLKFKTLSVSYKMPLNLPFLQEITVWGAADNLFTLTNYLGADPEFSYGNSVLYQGVDSGFVPSTRSYFVGVKINL